MAMNQIHVFLSPPCLPTCGIHKRPPEQQPHSAEQPVTGDRDPPACCSPVRSTGGRTSRRPSRSCCNSVLGFPGCPSWDPSRSSSGICGCGPARPCRRGSGGSGDCGACGGRGTGRASASCGSSSCACTAGKEGGLYQW